MPFAASSSASASTVAAALAEQLRSDPSRPVVTFYDDATGERVELSTATYANWVAKTAGLLDELGVERGAVALVDLPTHWLGTVWLGALWTLGAAVSPPGAVEPGSADVVVCGPEGVETYAPLADRVDVVALSLRPLGGRFAEALPVGVVDYGAVVLGQPDAFVPLDPAASSDVAWRDGDGGLTQADLLGPATGSAGRILTDVNPVGRSGVRLLLDPLLAGSGTVWVRHADPEGWESRRGAEHAERVVRG